MKNRRARRPDERLLPATVTKDLAMGSKDYITRDELLQWIKKRPDVPFDYELPKEPDIIDFYSMLRWLHIKSKETWADTMARHE